MEPQIILFDFAGLMVFHLIYSAWRISAYKVNRTTLINMKMKTDRYDSPSIEILRIEVEQTILTTSITGEDINEWEDMQN